MPAFDFKVEVVKIPEEPGVYRYYDEYNTVIYVGKAKNLKNRVSSYFQKLNQHDRKTKRLVSNIQKIEFTIVPTEYDALLLENTLVKKYQPKFNILLKDDKMYPFVCITNERFPRIIITRKIEDKTKGKLYGPFVNSKAMYALIEMFSQLYTIRTCNLNLSEENIVSKKFKICLEYHIGNCKGPCEALQSEENYLQEIEQVHQMLKGNITPAKQYFEQKMKEAAAKLAYEDAQQSKLKLEFLQTYQSRSTVVNPNIGDIDVFAIASDETSAYISFLKVSNGTITQTDLVALKKQIEESDEDILGMLIFELRDKYNSTSKEILTNIPIDLDLRASVAVPQIGDKKKLLDMALTNVLYFKREKAEREAIAASGSTNRRDRVLIKLKQDLQLKTLPRRIECFDNSNIQGTNPVSAMVCFINGKPANKEYRHYIPKTVIGPDDFATMREVIHRRYKRVLEEKTELPDLIIIDGGKGQLSAACESLKELGLYGSVIIIGIAKRLEEIYFPEDTLPIYIDKKSESLKLIQRCRDEAHRFGITHHRNRRSQTFLISSLEGAKGIGNITATKLMKHFKTISKMKEATDEELIQLLGKDKTHRLRAFFANE